MDRAGESQRDTTGVSHWEKHEERVNEIEQEKANWIDQEERANWIEQESVSGIAQDRANGIEQDIPSMG